MNKNQKKLQIAMFPWLAFEHMIPFLELAKLIAEKGHKISYISTPRNILRLPKIPLSENITFVSLPLPHVDNPPPDAEATSDVPLHLVPYLKIAHDGLQPSLSEFLEDFSPDWLVYDFAPHWLPPVAANLGISSVFFSMFHAWTITFSFSWKTINGEDDEEFRSTVEEWVVPPKWVPFPSKVAYKIHEAKRVCKQLELNESGVTDPFRFISAMKGCDVISLRSCAELESDYLSLLSELSNKPVLPVGLLQPGKTPHDDDDDDDAWLTVRQFLDDQEKRTALFIAFGSELALSQEEVSELALGLELSGLPFVWALRKRQGSDSVQLPEGFEERVKGRGLVWTGWAPQLKIMGHDSVGGFVTHCGFSSIAEALYFGRPIIMMPFAIDQGLVARVFEEKKVGIEVPRNEEDGTFTRESVAATARLVVAEKEGEVYRAKAEEMRRLFSDKEIHDGYVDRFLQFLQDHKSVLSNQ